MKPLNKQNTVTNYELGFFQIMQKNNHVPFAYVSNEQLVQSYLQSSNTNPQLINLIKKSKAFNPSNQFWDFLLYSSLNFPFLKREVTRKVWKNKIPSFPEIQNPSGIKAKELMKKYIQGDESSTGSNIELHQIYFKSEHLKHINVKQPYDNSQDNSGYCEYGVFMREFENIQKSSAKYIGFISWKFTQKTRKTPQDFLNFIEKNPGYDVYAMQPHNLSIFPKGVWKQGDRHHPGLIEIVELVIQELNLNPNIISYNYDPAKIITCNYWVGTKEFWKAYQDFTLPIANFLIQKAKDNPDLHKKLFVRTSKNPATWGMIFPYLMERLVVSLITLNPSFKVKIWHTANNTITK